ncbi:ABC transporter substrate-binding protein [Endozoicomonas sp. SM1973]|uniref:ABC transporter substrate-binding protein n=1 Tax=Spartinivicinus marinus TaxID=2994442 RepID=A0A853I4B8_9GAMM|nr:transporter substrate-binding domain-containing protein [Spartinivicinus marinus]MCX4029831.1 transporter substrate-binding domain-containing protein [Spartinivicinus marinus]NYZ67499.1 ABC transporter substrate-binding protein [Spartinivicinus marinus]
MRLPLFNAIMKSLVLLLLLLGSYVGGNVVAAEEMTDLIKKRFAKLTFITETYPPYNFVEKGILRGIAVDLLISAIQRHTITLKRQSIKVYPWARGYQKLLKGPNIVLFSTTRTDARESLFKWAGPISATRIVLIAAKSRQIKITSKLDTHNYIIGGIRDDVGEQLVLATGYPSNKFISQANASSIVRMLAKQRIDLWAYEEYVGSWFIKQNQLRVDDFETVFLLKEAQLYFAFSKDVDNNLVNLLQQGIDKVKKIPGTVGDTLYQDILGRYM